MTQVKFVMRPKDDATRIHPAPFDYTVLDIGQSEDPSTAIHADMASNNRKWPPIHINITNLDLRGLNLTPHQDVRVEADALTPPVIEGIKRLVDSPDVPDETTVYVVPGPKP